MSELLKQSLLIALCGIIVLPLTGFVVSFIVSRCLQIILGIVDKTGAVYLFFVNRLTFMGTVYHELSHALFAFLTGAKVNKISLYHMENGRLGYVRYTPRGPWILRSVQMSLASCAPVIMGILAEAGIALLFATKTLPVWGTILLGYLFISVLLHMDMSPEDLKAYMKGIPIFFVAFFIGGYLYLAGTA
ncbi:MAG: M50 family metallopeptidase [Lachnospiraceae bacterium]|nr:M50 family metallopeptidase [Lachnospiraceae bacterium]